MKHLLILGLIFIVGCGGRTLTRTEYQEKRPENHNHVKAICNQVDPENKEACILREKEKVYKNYVDTPSFPQRYLDTRKRRQNQKTFQSGQTVYDASECTGPVINGRCHGSILPNKAVHKKCYGTMLFGKCTGPMF